MNLRSAPAAARVILSSLVCGLVCLAPTPADATSSQTRIAGALAFPGARMPALRIYAWSPATRQLHATRTARNATTYQLDLPPGQYWVFALPDEPGAPEIFGAYSEYTVCARDAEALAAGRCTGHGLVEVAPAKPGTSKASGIDIDDWYLSDAVVTELAAVVGQPLVGSSPDDARFAAPKFSEYTVTVLSGATAPSVVESAEEPRVARDLALLREALVAGPTFAGRLGLVRAPCGPHCSDVALIDLGTGTVLYPPALSQVAADPCGTADSLQYRSDSRLLIETRGLDGKVQTTYYVWQPATRALTTLASVSADRSSACTQEQPATH
jgi:hypothetical protein